MRTKWSSHALGTVLNEPVVLSDTEKKTPLIVFVGNRATDQQHDNDYLVNSDVSLLTENDIENYDDNNSERHWGCNLKLYKGIFYSSMSSVFFSLCSVIVKYLDTIHPGELAIFRFVGIFLFTLPLVYRNGSNPFGPPELRHLLIFRGIAGATSLLLRFYAFRYLPIADASVIIFSVIVFVSIFACIFLNEPCGIFQTFTVFLTMIGLLMTTKLPLIFGSNGDININLFLINTSTDAVLLNQTLAKSATVNGTSLFLSQKDYLSIQKLHHLYGVISAMASTGFSAAVFIFIRKAKVAHHSIIMFNFGWVAILETTTITAFLNGFSLPSNLFQWSLIMLLGIFSFCGQNLLTLSLQLEQAGPVSVVRAATDIALAFCWQLWLFHEVPDGWSVAGALLVTICIMLTSLRKWIMSLPEHSAIRLRLFFFAI